MNHKYPKCYILNTDVRFPAALVFKLPASVATCNIYLLLVNTSSVVLLGQFGVNTAFGDL